MSANYLVCYNFQDASKSFKVGESCVKMLNSLDPGKTPSDLVSHLDPSCLHSGLFGRDRQDKG